MSVLGKILTVLVQLVSLFFMYASARAYVNDLDNDSEKIKKLRRSAVFTFMTGGMLFMLSVFFYMLLHVIL